MATHQDTTVEKFPSQALACASALSGVGEGVSFATLSSDNPEKLPSSDEVTKIQMLSAREGTRQPQVVWIKCSFSYDKGSPPLLQDRLTWVGSFKTCWAGTSLETGPAFLQGGNLLDSDLHVQPPDKGLGLSQSLGIIE